MSFHQLNHKHNGLVLLLKTILWQRNSFLSFDAADGKDGNGLKLEKLGQFFQVLMLCVMASSP